MPGWGGVHGVTGGCFTPPARRENREIPALRRRKPEAHRGRDFGVIRAAEQDLAGSRDFFPQSWKEIKMCREYLNLVLVGPGSFDSERGDPELAKGNKIGHDVV